MEEGRALIPVQITSPLWDTLQLYMLRSGTRLYYNNIEMIQPELLGFHNRSSTRTLHKTATQFGIQAWSSDTILMLTFLTTVLAQCSPNVIYPAMDIR